MNTEVPQLGKICYLDPNDPRVHEPEPEPEPEAEAVSIDWSTIGIDTPRDQTLGVRPESKEIVKLWAHPSVREDAVEGQIDVVFQMCSKWGQAMGPQGIVMTLLRACDHLAAACGVEPQEYRGLMARYAMQAPIFGNGHAPDCDCDEETKDKPS